MTTTPTDAVTAEQYALFAALRHGDPLPSGVVWALTDLLTQVAVTVHEADTGQLDGATAGALRGWLDVLGRAQHKLTNEWGTCGGDNFSDADRRYEAREESEEGSGRDNTGQAGTLTRLAAALVMDGVSPDLVMLDARQGCALAQTASHQSRS